jgi:predicted kinase
LSSNLALVVSGLPGSGKTTVARTLGSRLQVPVLERDRFAEVCFDALGSDGPGPRALGPVSWELLFCVAGQILPSGGSVLLESNFSRARHRDRLLGLVQGTGYHLVELHCQAPGDVLLQRFIARAKGGQRHERHEDVGRVDEFRAIFADPERHGDALLFPGDAVVLDTTTEVPIDDLTTHVNRALESRPA